MIDNDSHLNHVDRRKGALIMGVLLVNVNYITLFFNKCNVPVRL